MYLLSALCEKSTDKWWVQDLMCQSFHCLSLLATRYCDWQRKHNKSWRAQMVSTALFGYTTPLNIAFPETHKLIELRRCGYFCSSVIRHCPLSYKAGNSATQQIIRHTYVLSRSKPPLVSVKGKKIRKSVLKAQIKDKRKRKEWTLTLKWRGIVAKEIIRGPEI